MPIGPRLKASQDARTKAMSTKPHKAKMTENNLGADQNMARTCMENGQIMSRNGPKTKDMQSYQMEHNSTPTSTTHGMN